jgi:hypothetical protein
VPEVKLTRTFKDALQIVRSIGLQYLWIDSLCIIQDCEGDWAYESRLMGDIYSNSTMNLRACDSEDGNSGCIYDAREMATSIGVKKTRLEVAGT